MTTVALFGGSFNPPHAAHQMVCLYVLEVCGADSVLMVPTWRHAFSKELAPFEDRFAMCERAVDIFNGRVQVSRIEEELGQEKSRTLVTLQELMNRNPGVQYRLVVGSDILAETSKWYRWDEIERLAPPIVVGRKGYPGAFEVELPPISSTEVRARIGRGESVAELLPGSVIGYIARRGLYQ
jgi:nicotinate-nucleotide adenylyltransferase